MKRPLVQSITSALTLAVVCTLFVTIGQVSAQITPIPNPDPKPGGYGLEATKTQAPPAQGATITVLNSGGSFTN